MPDRAESMSLSWQQRPTRVVVIVEKADGTVIGYDGFPTELSIEQRYEPRHFSFSNDDYLNPFEQPPMLISMELHGTSYVMKMPPPPPTGPTAALEGQRALPPGET